jgi:hypothetical protein
MKAFSKFGPCLRAKQYVTQWSHVVWKARTHAQSDLEGVIGSDAEKFVGYFTGTSSDDGGALRALQDFVPLCSDETFASFGRDSTCNSKKGG